MKRWQHGIDDEAGRFHPFVIIDFMAEPDSAILTPAEVDSLLHELRRSRDELLQLLPAAESPLWQRSDGDQRWSVAEIVEHLMIAEDRAATITRKTVAEGPCDDWQKREVSSPRKIRATAHPWWKIEAPEILRPAHSLTPLELSTRFQECRETNLVLLEELRQQPLRAYLTPKHPFLGTLNLEQSFLLLACHTDRHIVQIRGCLELGA